MKRFFAALLLAVFMYQPCLAGDTSALEGTSWWLLFPMLSQGFYEGDVYVCWGNECGIIDGATYDDTSFTNEEGTFYGEVFQMPFLRGIGKLHLKAENGAIFNLFIYKKSNTFIPPAPVE